MEFTSSLLIPVGVTLVFQALFSLVRMAGFKVPTILFDSVFFGSQVGLILYSNFFNTVNLSVFALLFAFVYMGARLEKFVSFPALAVYCALWIHFRYLAPTFDAEWLRSVNEWLTTLIDPRYIIGTSYLAFRIVGFYIDRRAFADKDTSLIAFLGWLFFFPAIVSGPIHLFDAWCQQNRNRNIAVSELVRGTTRIVSGVLKNVVLSQVVWDYSAARFTDGAVYMLEPSAIVLGMLFYTIYIYLNFSGFTDMAIGLGLLWGVKLPENFNFPFFRRNLQDFWASWHISFIEWLRRYLFLPLLFTLSKQSWLVRRGKQLPTYISLWVLFIAVALWHAWTINYLFWGIANAVGLCVLHAMKVSFDWKRPALKWWKQSRLAYGISCVLTFCFTVATFGPLALTPHQFELLIERFEMHLGLIECEPPDSYLQEDQNKVTGLDARCIYYRYRREHGQYL